jgi:hypothetical protein
VLGPGQEAVLVVALDWCNHDFCHCSPAK